MTRRTQYSAEFKARVALDAIREELTLAELARKHGVHLNMISGWKRAAINNMAAAFGKDAGSATKANDAKIDKLYSVNRQVMLASPSGANQVRALLSSHWRKCREFEVHENHRQAVLEYTVVWIAPTSRDIAAQYPAGQ